MEKWRVGPEDSGKKLVDFLVQQLEGQYSTRLLKSLLNSGLGEVNGMVERFASTKVRAGDRITFRLSDANIAASSKPQFEKERILFEDAYLLVYNKPSGIPSQGKYGLEELLQAHDPTLQLVHRLDRGTSGVILFAKEQNVLDDLFRQFREGTVEKEYLAIVDGIPPRKKGRISNFLGPKKTYQGQTIWGEVKRGRRAVTEWKLLQAFGSASLLCCQPRTGRTHQIRVHMKDIGLPILGDYQYAKVFTCPLRPTRHLLHAHKLSFTHPTTQERISLAVDEPEDFKDCVERLEKGRVLKRWSGTEEGG